MKDAECLQAVKVELKGLDYGVMSIVAIHMPLWTANIFSSCWLMCLFAWSAPIECHIQVTEQQCLHLITYPITGRERMKTSHRVQPHIPAHIAQASNKERERLHESLYRADFLARQNKEPVDVLLANRWSRHMSIPNTTHDIHISLEKRRHSSSRADIFGYADWSIDCLFVQTL